MRRLAALFTLAILVSHVTNTAAAEPQRFVGFVTKVIDADSLRIAGSGPDIRLWGVDGPEWNQVGGPEGHELLQLIADGQVIACVAIDRSRGRINARCFLPSGIEINRQVIEHGPATEYCHFSRNAYGTCR
jgi:endonuclease YncB( thermonuclease family)